MRLLKKVMILIVIALIIQGSMLIFLDKYYFETDSKVVVPKIIKKQEKSIVIKVGVQSKEFQVSFDGMYLSFFDDNKLNVVNTILGTIEKVKTEDDLIISFYKWLPDNNKIIYAQKVPSKNGNLIKFYYYDINTNSSEEIKSKDANNSIAIEGSAASSKITDIILTPISNIMYIKLTSSDKQSLIYKLENMNSIKKTQISKTLIGKIDITPKDGMLYFEDLKAKKIKNLMGKSINIPNVERPIILGSDSDNNIYIADGLNSKINKLYWGILHDNSGSFNAKELKTPIDIKDIHITLQGKIYINDGLKGIVTELNSGIETPYNGVLRCMYDKGIASVDEEVFIKTPFK